MNNQPKTMRRASDLAAAYLDHLVARSEGEKRYIPSNFRALDAAVPAALHEGHLIIIAGRPAMGKTSLAEQIVEHVAAQDRTALFFSLEMSAYEITERAIARRSGVPIPKLKTCEGLTDDDWSRIPDAADAFSRLPLLVDDGSFGIDEIVHKAKAAAANCQRAGLPPLGLVVVDYLQLVAAKAANRTLEIGQVSGALKRLAKELQCPVVALSQLNRGVEGRVDKRPTLSDLRESGAIEQDADLVMLLYRDDYYNPDSLDKGTAEVIIAKNRHGSTGMTRLAFTPERVMFSDLAFDHTAASMKNVPATQAKTPAKGKGQGYERLEIVPF